ncbi:hypothetical protein ALC60_04265 [Trachymyrmex zeteki]|uniref:Uncharacterized protein n=1 Tax=Mycetomoellerius zeteki TaxID=64791 RepID=A0A151X8G3_9HYME|nr:hypothetical protein ALC60_04265 [Trachymyrmex zeteki]
MLKSAGRLTTRAKSSLRIPFAALMSLKILPILNTLTTRTGKSIMISSIRIPRMDANTINFAFAWILREKNNLGYRHLCFGGGGGGDGGGGGGGGSGNGDGDSRGGYRVPARTSTAATDANPHPWHPQRAQPTPSQRFVTPTWRRIDCKRCLSGLETLRTSATGEGHSTGNVLKIGRRPKLAYIGFARDELTKDFLSCSR